MTAPFVLHGGSPARSEAILLPGFVPTEESGKGPKGLHLRFCFRWPRSWRGAKLESVLTQVAGWPQRASSRLSRQLSSQTESQSS